MKYEVVICSNAVIRLYVVKVAGGMTIFGRAGMPLECFSVRRFFQHHMRKLVHFN